MEKILIKINGMTNETMNNALDDLTILNRTVDALNNSVCLGFGNHIVYEQEMAIVVELTQEVPLYIMDCTKEALRVRGLDYNLIFLK